MRKLTRKILVVVSLIMVFSNISNAQVSINKDGSAPIYSSILHVKGDATNKNIIFEPGASGRVGIGTTDPNALLHINSVTSENPFRVQINGQSKLFTLANGGTGIGGYATSLPENGLYVNGNVGIGTTIPSHKLTIKASPSDSSVLRLIGPDDDTYGYGARMNFGDLNRVYLEEDEDDKLTIFSHFRTAIMGGNVGIGTENPDAKLEVAGQVKITGGTPGDGKVLTSDANGLASWQTQSPDVGNYGVVTNPVTGKRWLDRNLGASQVATYSTDAAAYGDLYQWGRSQDGHENRYSATTTTNATTWIADEGNNAWDTKFITGTYYWLSPANDELWKGTDAENNPCPSGFRIPTNAEWNQERRTWATNDAAGAFGSVLKLTSGGTRQYTDGSIQFDGYSGFYWSSTVNDSSARRLYFNSSTANMAEYHRAGGYSVRCIED